MIDKQDIGKLAYKIPMNTGAGSKSFCFASFAGSRLNLFRKSKLSQVRNRSIIGKP